MSRTRKSPSRSAAPTEGTAIAPAAPALPAITRADANRLLKERAQELFHEARAQREERIRQFEGEFGRADRIDNTLLRDLQNLQVRFAAIAARQHKYGSNSEPTVSKYAKQLGDIIGTLSAHLATERALELFAPVEEREYVGFGGTIGRKGLDESILGGYAIVDDPQGPKNVTPTVLDEEESQVCLHENVEPIEDEPTRGVCAECGEEFALADPSEHVA
ncbi:MAG: hypothetical protein ACYDGM_09630 [Vulcanimicrobiaceae bacterium]